MKTPKEKYLERRAKQKKLMEDNARKKKQVATGATLVIKDPVARANIVKELRLQGASEAEIRSFEEAPAEFLVTRNKKKGTNQ